MTLDKFPSNHLYPWGNERGSIELEVEYLIEHKIEDNKVRS
jgi:hypothetical protein